MFTGIVAEIGAVAALERESAGARISVRAERTAGGLAVGDSVAVEGVCLTATAVQGGEFRADVSGETLAASTLGDLRPGDPVNLEAAMALGAPLGGHLVQGHVDGVGTVRELRRAEGGYYLRVEVPPGIGRYVVEKGSVAVSGVSLTAIDVSAEAFGVALIPHTYERTTLQRLRPGSRVNVEADLIAKYVERFVSGGAAEGLSAERLAELGYGT
ncbi:MAG: riboflavin synthase [Candidatus Zixiibacteriota bacterium]|jgi:riboflavin synthase